MEGIDSVCYMSALASPLSSLFVGIKLFRKAVSKSWEIWSNMLRSKVIIVWKIIFEFGKEGGGYIKFPLKLEMKLSIVIDEQPQ
jgi:hypothetical protein